VKTHLNMLCVLLLLFWASSLLAQGSQPSQPIDPTLQAPAMQAPTTPPTFPKSEAKAKPERSDARVYVGTILKDGDTYVLKTANEKYLLDSQKKVKKFNRNDVKITGTLDDAKNLIHVQKIEVSPSM